MSVLKEQVQAYGSHEQSWIILSAYLWSMNNTCNKKRSIPSLGMSHFSRRIDWATWKSTKHYGQRTGSYCSPWEGCIRRCFAHSGLQSPRCVHCSTWTIGHHWTQTKRNQDTHWQSTSEPGWELKHSALCKLSKTESIPEKYLNPVGISEVCLESQMSTSACEEQIWSSNGQLLRDSVVSRSLFCFLLFSSSFSPISLPQVDQSYLSPDSQAPGKRLYFLVCAHHHSAIGWVREYI